MKNIEEKYVFEGGECNSFEDAIKARDNAQIKKVYRVKDIIFDDEVTAYRETLVNKAADALKQYSMNTPHKLMAKIIFNILDISHRGLQAGDYCDAPKCRGSYEETLPDLFVCKECRRRVRYIDGEIMEVEK